MQPTLAVGIVWRGIHASGGWNCLPAAGGDGGTTYRGRGVRRFGDGALGLWQHRATLNPHTRRREYIRGALRGESPRTREGRRPDRPQGYRKVYSSTLAENGPFTGHDSSVTRGMEICFSVLDCTRPGHCGRLPNHSQSARIKRLWLVISVLRPVMGNDLYWTSLPTGCAL